MSVKDNKAFLLADKGLDEVPCHTKQEDVTRETSSDGKLYPPGNVVKDDFLAARPALWADL